MWATTGEVVKFGRGEEGKVWLKKVANPSSWFLRKDWHLSFCSWLHNDEFSWRNLLSFNLGVVEDPLPRGVANDKAPELCSVFVLKLLKQDTHRLFIQSNQDNMRSNSLKESQEGKQRLLLTYAIHRIHLFHWSCWLKQECRWAFLPGRVIELSTHSQKLIFFTFSCSAFQARSWTSCSCRGSWPTLSN